MRQVWITKAGQPEVLQLRDLPLTVPKNGEVRIRVEAAGVNFADILGRMGMYGDAPPLPYVPGYEVAGTVDKLSQGVVGLKEGDEVMALTRFGGYSEAVCVPYQQVFKRLEWMAADDGAALPVNYLTAYVMLIVMGSLHAGDKVLIHQAAGGVGLAALDICRIIGAETFGTASPHKHDALRQKGLDHPLDYRHEDYERQLVDQLDGKGLDIILDPLGGVHWKKNYRLLAPTGRLVHFGLSSMAPGKRRSLARMGRALVMLPFYTPLSLMSDNKGVMGVNLAHLWAETERLSTWMAQLYTWYDEALFRPTIDRSFFLNQAAEAHHYIQNRENLGKVLLKP
jgi:NADPH:quinone reductase-like Zn-dependent oxidoreductase